MLKVGRMLAFVILLPGLAGGAVAGEKLRWRGYTQIRLRSASRENPGFSIRRTKFVLKGPAPYSGIRFAVQGSLKASKGGAFVLQDVFLEKSFEWGWLRVGQMVPRFSLQRTQSDSKIPLIERALPIKALIPTAETDGRDIGMQIGLFSAARRGELYVGVFNGNGGNRTENEDGNFLFTLRTVWHAVQAKGRDFSLGLSASYRRTAGLRFRKIFGLSHLFRGTDRRYALEWHWRAGAAEFQAEYVWANLGSSSADGGYALLTLDVRHNHKLSFSAEQLHDLIAVTSDRPWFILGYDILIKGNDAKLMLDARVQPAPHETNRAATVQFQLFFH